jgi:hypothetical protein
MAKRQGRYSCVGLFSALPSGRQGRFDLGLSVCLKMGYTPGMTNLQGKMMINSIKFGGYMGVPNFQTHPDGSLKMRGDLLVHHGL